MRFALPWSLREYIDARRELLLSEERDPAAMLAGIAAAEAGRVVLERFVHYGLR